jgi:hypothetical protein
MSHTYRGDFLRDAPLTVAIPYHIVGVAMLLYGFLVWRQVMLQWRVCYRQATVVIRAYAWITFADGLLLFTYFLTILQGITVGFNRK